MVGDAAADAVGRAEVQHRVVGEQLGHRVPGAAGILLPEDAADLMARAEGSSIPDRGVRSPLPTHLVPEPV